MQGRGVSRLSAYYICKRWFCREGRVEKRMTEQKGKVEKKKVGVLIHVVL